MAERNEYNDFFMAENTDAEKFPITSDAPWTFLIPHPTSGPREGEVFLVAEDKTFCVREDILTAGSEYFETCLCKEGWTESQTKTVVFSDIEAAHLGLYLNFVYQAKLIGRIILPSLGEPRGCVWLPAFITVYQLCDRFGNWDILDAISQCLYEEFGVDGEDGPWTEESSRHEYEITFWTKSLSQAFGTLNPDDPDQAELRQMAITCFCNWFPHSEFDNYVHLFEHQQEFVVEVAKRFARMIQKRKPKLRR